MTCCTVGNCISFLLCGFAYVAKGQFCLQMSLDKFCKIYEHSWSLNTSWLMYFGLMTKVKVLNKAWNNFYFPQNAMLDASISVEAWLFSLSREWQILKIIFLKTRYYSFFCNIFVVSRSLAFWTIVPLHTSVHQLQDFRTLFMIVEYVLFHALWADDWGQL